MRTIAVYSLKGGVGKTSLAVNLAWASATLSSRRTLLWDLDGQAAAGFLLGSDQLRGSAEAQALFAREIEPAKLIEETATPRLQLLPADRSLRQLDQVFLSLGKKKRLEKLLQGIERDYDRVVLDCPPGLTETSDQILRAADLVIIPVIPSPLSQRAFEDVVQHLDRRSRRRSAVLPVFSMVDRRRSLHLEALAQQPDWPVIPMASAVEAMSRRRAPLGSFAPHSPAAQAIALLWRAIERRLARAPKAG